MVGRELSIVAFMILSSCAAAYEPLVVGNGASLPGDAFERCREVLLARYGGLELADREGLRLRTVWAPMPELDVPGQQRAAVFREGGGIGVIVEARYLTQGLLGGVPGWTTPRPAVHLERELGELIEGALVQPAGPTDLGN